jgi:cellulose synthase/poly-beta-1,6-N-acetylglucosamine synthase-like glycosyltransferase
VTLVSVIVAVVAAFVAAYGLFTLWLMLSAWNRPDRLRATAGPKKFAEPGLRFAVLIPAREEEAVIGETVARVWAANYPRAMLEVIVICQRDDTATIAAVSRQLERLRSDRVRLVTYDEEPFNKPHALNVGYAASGGDVVTVFDAEDDVHPDIFNVMNTVMLEQEVGVVQGGVQLMNFTEHWFAAFNCVEYFFYFRSRLHFNASVGMVPLGGNTVAIRRELVDRVGGWDVGCLTEDADIGVRLSALGEPIRVVYNSRWVTREETPHTVTAMIQQRTRWCQGFLQVFIKGDWRRIPGARRRALAAATFAQPLVDGLLISFVPLIPFAFIYLHLPVLAALISLAPLYVLGLQMLAGTVGLVEFARLYGERLPPLLVVRMPFTYLACQWLIGYSALRAIVRLVRGRSEWEKTEHYGGHRTATVAALPARPQLAEPLARPQDVVIVAAQPSQEPAA